MPIVTPILVGQTKGREHHHQYQQSPLQEDGVKATKTMDDGEGGSSGGEGRRRRRKRRAAMLTRQVLVLATLAGCLVGFGLVVQDHLVKYVRGKTGVSVVYTPSKKHEVRGRVGRSWAPKWGTSWKVVGVGK